MKDAHETHDLQQRTEQWLVNTAQDAYADPKNHLLEMGCRSFGDGCCYSNYSGRNFAVEQ
jgi:hypothetical protein